MYRTVTGLLVNRIGSSYVYLNILELTRETDPGLGEVETDISQQHRKSHVEFTIEDTLQKRP